MRFLHNADQDFGAWLKKNFFGEVVSGANQLVYIFV
jgi:hypothetical protein